MAGPRRTQPIFYSPLFLPQLSFPLQVLTVPLPLLSTHMRSKSAANSKRQKKILFRVCYDSPSPRKKHCKRISQHGRQKKERRGRRRTFIIFSSRRRRGGRKNSESWSLPTRRKGPKKGKKDRKKGEKDPCRRRRAQYDGSGYHSYT